MIGIQPEDIAVLYAILTAEKSGQTINEPSIETALFLPQGFVQKSIPRLDTVRLFDAALWRVNRSSFVEMIVYGAKFFVMPRLVENSNGNPRQSIGLATSSFAPPLCDLFFKTQQDLLVWELPSSYRGANSAFVLTGQVLEPLYEGSALACLAHPWLYHFLSLFDAIRIGQARERSLATNLLKKLLA